MNLDWMAWTATTGAFFGVIALALLVMIALAVWRPETPREGILGLETTRGDRLFLTLLGAAFIHLAWLGLSSAELGYASAIALLYGAAVFRWV